jgi:putative RecB family exonuclease
VTQLPLDGMPVRLVTGTPSSLSSFATCPRRYRMTYIDRPALPKGPPWAHNSMGAAVHSALRAWWDEPLERRTPVRAGALVELSWLSDGWRDNDQSDRWRSRARAMVESYVETLDPTDEPVAVERQVAAKTDRLALSGRIDRLDHRDGELVVVDYKTGRHLLTTDDVRSSMAMAIYAVGVSRTLRRPCRRVELHHLPSGRVLAWEHEPAALDRHIRRAEDLAIDIAAARNALETGTDPDEAFPPTPGSLCSWCDYRRHCPEGQVASPRREPWDALGELP